MTSKRINVLVYSGEGTRTEPVAHCLYSLRSLLSPNYAVFPVTDSVILGEPWMQSCALLVFPGGADLGYCSSLNGKGNSRISQFVRQGGAYLGFCAGGYYGSQRCEFEVGNKDIEVIGDRELAFFPGVCRGCAFKGFKYSSEAGARAVQLKVKKGFFTNESPPIVFRSYYNGGGVFVNAAKAIDRGVEVLASYVEPVDVDSGDDGLGAAAIVYCKVGDGKAMLTGPHPEFAGVNLNPSSGGPEYSKIVDAVLEDDETRTRFLKACLSKLSLRVPQGTSSIPPQSPLHLSALNPVDVSLLLEDLKDVITIEGEEEYIKGGNDTFHIEKENSRWSMGTLVKSLPIINSAGAEDRSITGVHSMSVEGKVIDYGNVLKSLVPHENDWPDAKATPYFNHQKFFASLRRYQQEHSSEAEEFGQILMYGEVVNSTNTILEKNPNFLSHLPNGFTVAATLQVAGRGRGSNVWISPAGSLTFSICIKHPVVLSNVAPAVFIQYLASIAVVEGVQSYDHGYGNVPVRLKWPNDIYAEDHTQPNRKEYIKIGGVLVNSSFSCGVYNLVVGIGLNAANSNPTTSLNGLLPPSLAPFCLEKLLARILTKFETIYKNFCRTGFDKRLEEIYYRYWLHNDQIVTLEDEGGIRARILGITTDWGFLRAMELGWEDTPTGRVWQLQSDSNSFDFFKGLVRRKT